MFTGLIEEIGTVDRVHSLGGGIRIRIHAPASAQELAVDDSVSVNGVCQTVVAGSGAAFEVVAVEETLRKTTFGSLGPGSKVNLELPLRLNDRLGGHLVLGHVDAAGAITGIEPKSASWLFTVAVPPEFARYLVHTGSVTIDGVSLTAATVRPECVVVSIIPHTMEKTIFQYYRVGDRVNLEFDVIGKYIERLMSAGRERVEFPDEEHLRGMGF